jgi:hypothetical protein
LVAGDLLDERDIAEFAVGGLPSGFFGFPARNPIADGHLQVALDFVTEFISLLRFSPGREFHVLLLFITQSYERIDAHGSPRRDVARCKSHKREQHGHASETERIGSAHAIQQAAKKTR